MNIFLFDKERFASTVLDNVSIAFFYCATEQI